MNRVIVVAALAGCSGARVGTLDLDVTTAPGSTVLDTVTVLRFTMTRPHQVFEIARTDQGFDLSLDLEATGTNTILIVEGLDASGQRVVVGMSPPFPFAAIDGHVVIYLAPPMSLGAAPRPLEPARHAVASARLTYGAALAGGLDAAGAPSTAIQVYNSYDHSLTGGLPLPGARAGVIAAGGSNGGVYLFGGRDPAGTATGTLWRFDTTVAPSGHYDELANVAELARADQRAVALGNEHFLITGHPIADLDRGVLGARSELAGATSGDAVTAGNDTIALFADDQNGGRLSRYRASTNAFEPLDVQRPGATVLALPGARFAVIGPDDVLGVDAATGDVTPAAPLASPGTSPVAAATPRFVAIVGADRAIEVRTADTLAPVAVLPNTDDISTAIALPNEQILFAGATLQLFTPPPPE